MRIDLKRKSAYTLAEIMVVLLLLTLIFAAFSPIITRRMAKDRSGDVWTSTEAPDYDAYTEPFNPSDAGSMYVGVTPAAKQDTEAEAFLPSAKLVVRSGVLSNNKKQVQFQFRRGDRSGDDQTRDFAGTMFVDDNENMLIGSSFSGFLTPNNEEWAPSKNVALGYGALDGLSYSNLKDMDVLANFSHSNVALGYNALNALDIGYDNVAVGSGAGESSIHRLESYICVVGQPCAIGETKEGINSTFVGYNAGRYVKGYIRMTVNGITLDYNNARDNVAVGYKAFGRGQYSSSTTFYPTGYNNTFLGAFAGYNNVGWKQSGRDSVFVGSNNIAIGYEAMGMASGGITNMSGHDNIAIGAGALKNLTTGSYNVAIGYGACGEVTSGSYKTCIGYHSGPHAGTKGIFYNNGQSSNAYFDGRTDSIQRTYIGSQPYGPNTYFGGDAVLEIHNPPQLSTGLLNSNIGSDKTSNTTTIINGNLIVRGRPYFTVGSTLYHFHDFSDSNNYYYGYKTGDGGDYGNVPNPTDGGKYYLFNDGNNKYRFPNLFVPSGSSMSSDRRLKNISGKFTAGLNELRNIKVYNYTFKNDKDKKPHVGVIAQELQKVFPTAVYKGEDGYLRIRWDEMFYAMINGIKELDRKIASIIKRTAKFDTQITKLEKENVILKSQVDNLTQRVNQLKAQ